MPDPTERPDWDAMKATWPHADASRFVDAAGVRWHVQVAGTGPALLLLHGTGGATHSWADVIPVLARDHTVVVPDLPGQGFSTALPTPPAIDAMARAVAACCAARGLAPTAAAGHSAGAAILLAIARDRLLPLRAIVGFGAALVPPPSAYRDLVAPLLRPLVTAPWTASIGAALGAQPALADLALAGASDALPAAQRARYHALFATRAHVEGSLAMMAHWDLEALLRSLAGAALPPVTLVHGTRDGFVPLARLREVLGRVPAATLVTWEGAGHLLHEERPAAAAAAIRRAISGPHAGEGPA